MTIYTEWDYGDYHCKHGKDVFYCLECQRERELKLQQEAHEASVKRQKAKLKLAPWSAGETKEKA